MAQVANVACCKITVVVHKSQRYVEIAGKYSMATEDATQAHMKTNNWPHLPTT